VRAALIGGADFFCLISRISARIVFNSVCCGRKPYKKILVAGGCASLTKIFIGCIIEIIKGIKRKGQSRVSRDQSIPIAAGL
jgi:hypothetical protein